MALPLLGSGGASIMTKPFNLVWWWRARLPDRKGQACRVLARGALNTVLVEFADGYKVFTSRYAVRKMKQ